MENQTLQAELSVITLFYSRVLQIYNQIVQMFDKVFNGPYDEIFTA
jgi:hypothetical protein